MHDLRAVGLAVPGEGRDVLRARVRQLRRPDDEGQGAVRGGERRARTQRAREPLRELPRARRAPLALLRTDALAGQGCARQPEPPLPVLSCPAPHLVPSSLCPQLPPVSPLLTAPLPLHRTPLPMCTPRAHTYTPFPVTPLTPTSPAPHPCPAKADPVVPPPAAHHALLTSLCLCRSGRDQPDHLWQLRALLHGTLRR